MKTLRSLALASLGLALLPSTALAWDGYFFDSNTEVLYGFTSDGSAAPAAVYTPDARTGCCGIVFGIAVDTTNEKLYWGEGWRWEGPVELHRSDLDRSNHEVLATDLYSTHGVDIIRHIAIDPVNEHVYFDDDPTVFRTNLGGGDFTQLTAANEGGSVALSADGSELWYTAWPGEVRRQDLATGTVEVLTDIRGAAGNFFLTDEHVYYTGWGDPTHIQRRDLDFSDSSQETVGYLGDRVASFAVDGDKLYYATMTAYNNGDVRAIDLASAALPIDYNEGHEVVVSGTGKVANMALVAGGTVGGSDSDGDGVPDNSDVCEGYDDTLDEDGDSVPDGCDVCEGLDSAGDTDSDGVCDDIDLCPVDYDDQSDTDGDGIGDACEADTDEDGVIDDDDNCPSDSNPDQADSEGDGLGDVCDDDDDNDGVLDGADNCPLIDNADQDDFDGDGAGDICDGDDDADGIDDEDDLCPGTPMDLAYNSEGCSGAQYVELSVGSCSAYDNTGSYVSAVSHASNEAKKDGLLTGKEKAAITKAASKACD